MFTGGTSWAPAGHRSSTTTLPPERPILRGLVRGLDYGTADRDLGGYRHHGDRHTGYGNSGHDSSGHDSFGHDSSGYSRAGYDIAGYENVGYGSARYGHDGGGQLSFRLADHIVPQRKPLDDDHQLCLDIPVQLGRSARAASPGGEPRHRNIAHRWVSALLETATGRRDRRQLDRLLYRGVDPPLADLAAARRGCRIHSCSPADEVIYVAVALYVGTRVRALTAELRSDTATAWRYAAIDLI